LASNTTEAAAGSIRDTTDTIILAPQRASCKALQSPRVQGSYVNEGRIQRVFGGARA
jgi:hypothetical protein